MVKINYFQTLCENRATKCSGRASLEVLNNETEHASFELKKTVMY